MSLVEVHFRPCIIRSNIIIIYIFYVSFFLVLVVLFWFVSACCVIIIRMLVFFFLFAEPSMPLYISLISPFGVGGAVLYADM